MGPIPHLVAMLETQVLDPTIWSVVSNPEALSWILLPAFPCLGKLPALPNRLAQRHVQVGLRSQLKLTELLCTYIGGLWRPESRTTIWKAFILTPRSERGWEISQLNHTWLCDCPFPSTLTLFTSQACFNIESKPEMFRPRYPQSYRAKAWTCVSLTFP